MAMATQQELQAAGDDGDWGAGTLLASFAVAGAGAAALFGRLSGQGRREADATSAREPAQQVSMQPDDGDGATATETYHYVWSHDQTAWAGSAQDVKREVGAVVWSETEAFKLLVGRYVAHQSASLSGSRCRNATHCHLYAFSPVRTMGHATKSRLLSGGVTSL